MFGPSGFERTGAPAAPPLPGRPLTTPRVIRAGGRRLTTPRVIRFRRAARRPLRRPPRSRRVIHRVTSVTRVIHRVTDVTRVIHRVTSVTPPRTVNPQVAVDSREFTRRGHDAPYRILPIET